MVALPPESKRKESSASDAPRPTSASGQGKGSWVTSLLLASLLGGLWFWQSHLQGRLYPEVDYSTARQWIEQGHVHSVVLRDRALEAELDQEQDFQGSHVKLFRAVTPLEDARLLPLLQDKGVAIRVVIDQQPFGLQVALAILPWLLIGGVWYFLARRTQAMIGQTGLGAISKAKPHRFEKSSSVQVTFDDVAGLKAAKRDLEEIVQFLKEPEHFRRLGGKIPRGVLLVGPPGTGKTLLARAVAGESGVPFFSISASEFIEMFVGVGAAWVRELFAEAKRSAPAIVFIDEIDAVGRSRGTGLGGGHDEREQTLNQLLSEMDGFNRNDMTIVLAATNRPDVLDPALLRPGRFDRRVMVDRPETGARKAILLVHTRGKPLGPDVVIEQLAQNTPGFSGADLANLVNEAALHATRRNAELITASDFAVAFDKIVLGDPREAKLDPDEKRRVAYHEAGHTIVARFCDPSAPVKRVSILPRGMALGATQQVPVNDRHLLTEDQLQTRLAVLLGGYACERRLLGSISSGAENDLQEAMKIAGRMVANYGMSPKLGPVHYEQHVEHPFLGQNIATNNALGAVTQELIEAEVRRLMSQALTRAEAELEAHRGRVEALATALIEHETLEQEQLQSLLPVVEAGVSLSPAQRVLGLG